VNYENRGCFLGNTVYYYFHAEPNAATDCIIWLYMANDVCPRALTVTIPLP